MGNLRRVAAVHVQLILLWHVSSFREAVVVRKISLLIGDMTSKSQGLSRQGVQVQILLWTRIN